MCSTSKEAPSLGYGTDAVVIKADSALKAVQVAGAETSRRSVTVINNPDGTADVYLVGAAGQSRASGVKLKPGGGYTLNTIAPVFIVGDAAVDTTVYVVTESGTHQ